MNNDHKFRILLLHANTPMDTLIPPALATLSACLKRAGNEVRLFDTTFYNTRGFTGDDARVRTLQVKKTNFKKLGIEFESTDMIEDFKKIIEEYKPDLIGVSVVEVTFNMSMDLINSVKQDNPNIKVAFGGSFPITAPESVISENNVDIVCIGEAENSFVELCDKLKNNEDYTGILNLWVKKDGQTYKNRLGNLIDLDDLPYQDWDIFDKRRIYKPMSGTIGRTGCFELTRGCVFSCTFCINEHLNKIHNHKSYREKSIPRYIDEVKYFKDKYDLEYVYILAEMFLPTTKQRIRDFSRLWKEKVGMPFWVELRVEGVDEENARLLEEAGCSSVTVGIESGNEEYRKKTIHRMMSNQRMIDACRILMKTKMQISGNSIIGFPGETREMIFDTIELNRKLELSNTMVHVFSPYRGTSLYDLSVKKGYMPPDQIAGDYRSDVTLNMPHLTKEEVLGLHRTFAMYVKFPKEMWPEIRIAERFDEEGNKKFDDLSKIYKEKFLEKTLKYLM
ncbi:MAG: B12-binding domain-containing radical SAM protein [Nanoarchaeota archaeon]|nr:B12-binding domain-containing radical SAM protein [Nanoarchaeota archaeon]